MRLCTPRGPVEAAWAGEGSTAQNSPGTSLGSHRARFWEGPWSAFRDQSQAGAPEQSPSLDDPQQELNFGPLLPRLNLGGHLRTTGVLLVDANNIRGTAGFSLPMPRLCACVRTRAYVRSFGIYPPASARALGFAHASVHPCVRLRIHPSMRLDRQTDGYRHVRMYVQALP